MKAQILDVYQESKSPFRACVIDVVDNHFDKGEQGVKVVNLSTGDVLFVHHYECENPIIEDINSIDSEQTIEKDIATLRETIEDLQQ